MLFNVFTATYGLLQSFKAVDGTNFVRNLLFKQWPTGITEIMGLINLPGTLKHFAAVYSLKLNFEQFERNISRAQKLRLA